ncbi:MAG: Foldase protein PrsA 1 precursor [Syntrophorhabdus sp. PtaU1.Bin058]|nr:MAG: Foldase protein PrsA 1 precursor [Syntrophorhabdus sp. PtaU1.Bin058]
MGRKRAYMAIGRTIKGLAVHFCILTSVFCILTSVFCISPAQAQKKPGVVAVVNGAEISVDDFNRELNRIQRIVLNTGKPLTCSQVTRLRTEVVEGMVRRELLIQESLTKVKVTEAEINEALKKLKEQYPSETDFTNALTEMRISPAALRKQVERTLAVQKMIETQFASKASVTDKEIWAYYDRNRDSFRQPEQVRASHILIKTDPQWDAKKKAEARKKIDDVMAKLKQKQDFESLARAYSEDPSASKGGDIGYVRQGQLLKPFEEALFALKPGEVSEVMETRLGYHIIKATDRKPETTVPFENLKDRIRTLLKQEKGQQEANAYIATVRGKAKVEISLPPEE